MLELKLNTENSIDLEKLPYAQTEFIVNNLEYINFNELSKIPRLLHINLVKELKFLLNFDEVSKHDFMFPLPLFVPDEVNYETLHKNAKFKIAKIFDSILKLNENSNNENLVSSFFNNKNIPNDFKREVVNEMKIINSKLVSILKEAWTVVSSDVLKLMENYRLGGKTIVKNEMILDEIKNANLDSDLQKCIDLMNNKLIESKIVFLRNGKLSNLEMITNHNIDPSRLKLKFHEFDDVLKTQYKHKYTERDDLGICMKFIEHYTYDEIFKIIHRENEQISYSNIFRFAKDISSALNLGENYLSEIFSKINIDTWIDFTKGPITPFEVFNILINYTETPKEDYIKLFKLNFKEIEILQIEASANIDFKDFINPISENSKLPDKILENKCDDYAKEIDANLFLLNNPNAEISKELVDSLLYDIIKNEENTSSLIAGNHHQYSVKSELAHLYMKAIMNKPDTDLKNCLNILEFIVSKITNANFEISYIKNVYIFWCMFRDYSYLLNWTSSKELDENDIKYINEILIKEFLK